MLAWYLFIVLLIVLARGTLAQLPFDMPSTASLRTSPRHIFSHYFTPFPISIDNKSPDSDYYAVQYLRPSGESGKHAYCGGFLRDRPLPRAPLNGSWPMTDMQNEVRQAIDAGLDGFIVDILTLAPTNAIWTRVISLLQAAAVVDPGFKIVAMPDMSALSSVNQSDLAASLAEFASYSSSFHLPDGRFVVSPFLAEAFSPAWYTQLFGILNTTYNISVAFVPCFLNFGLYRASFKNISYGYGNWGNRNPASQGGGAANAAAAHADGCLWMQPISTQDERPPSNVYDEACNTENLRATWTDAQAGANWTQLVTWNDYSENANIAPSIRNGYNWLDINAYYIVKWKNGGVAPTIMRDVLYVTHRIQNYSVMPAYNQTSFQKLRQYSSQPRDTVEVLSFLTTTGDVSVSIGGTAQNYIAPAGVFAQLFSLQVGNISASLYRNGAWVTGVTSPFPVTATPYVQDLGYYAVSSGRTPSPAPLITAPPTVTASASTSDVIITSATISGATSQVTIISTTSDAVSALIGTTAFTSVSTSSQLPRSDSSKKAFPISAIVGIVIGSVIILAVIVAVLIYALWWRPNHSSDSNYNLEM